MYHIFWIPKYRKNVLNGGLANRVKELLIQCAEVTNWKVQEVNVQVDNIHTIIQLDTKTSIARAVQLFKRGSSKKIREESFLS
jgi:putative transposase